MTSAKTPRWISTALWQMDSEVHNGKKDYYEGLKGQRLWKMQCWPLVILAILIGRSKDGAMEWSCVSRQCDKYQALFPPLMWLKKRTKWLILFQNCLPQHWTRSKHGDGLVLAIEVIILSTSVQKWNRKSVLIRDADGQAFIVQKELRCYAKSDAGRMQQVICPHSRNKHYELKLPPLYTHKKEDLYKWHLLWRIFW